MAAAANRIVETIEDFQLTVRQRLFVIELFANGFAVGRAAVAAGYSAKQAAKGRHPVAMRPAVRAAIRAGLEAIGIRADLIVKMLFAVGVHADAADFWPLVMGKATLPQLRARGVDTRVVKSVTPVETSDGVRYKVELHDRVRAGTKLLDYLGASEGMRADETAAEGDGDADGEVLPMGDFYRRVIIEQSSRPLVPGIPAPKLPDGLFDNGQSDGPD